MLPYWPYCIDFQLYGQSLPLSPLSLSLSLTHTDTEGKVLSVQDHNPTAENESHSNAKLTDALEHKHRNTLTTLNHQTKKLHKFSDLSLLCFKLISFRSSLSSST
ncbi:unnamed protein product [Prunus brigantina]